MAAACASEEDFPTACYLEPFGHGFSGLNAFGSSHSFFICLSNADAFTRSRWICRLSFFEFESLSSQSVQLISKRSRRSAQLGVALAIPIPQARPHPGRKQTI